MSAKCFYMSNEKNFSLLLLLCHCRYFFIHFCLFFVLVFFCVIVIFVDTTLDKFQFQSQVRLSGINIVAPMRLKFKHCAVFIVWGSRISFLFVGRQIIVNYLDFPSKVSRNCHKTFVPKIAQHDQWRMFVKMSPRARLVCFTDTAGMTLLAVFLVLPLPNCFLTVCIRTLVAALLKIFLPQTTTTFFNAANSNKSAPTRFAAGTIKLRKNGNAILPITCASALNPHLRCQPIPL